MTGRERIQVDVVALGGGPGATPGALFLARKGMKVAIVEKGEGLGGTCLFEGCIPSKILLETAGRRYEMSRSEEFGLRDTVVGEVDVPALMARKVGILAARAQGAEQACARSGITILHGTGDFLSPHEVIVRRSGEPDVIVEAKWVLAAPGSVATSVPIRGADAPGVWSSADALDLPRLPRSITIIGAGYIGCELATLFARLGSQVHVLEAASSLLTTEDPAAAAAVRSSFESMGIGLSEGVFIEAIDRVAEGEWSVRCRLSDGTARLIPSERVLVAVGRRPNSAALDWEAAGITVGERGEIPVNGFYQTKVPHIYAPGDINGRIMLAHAATRQSIVAAQHLLGVLDGMDAPNLIVPHVIFTSPEIASVGADSRALADHPEWTLTKWPFARDVRALIVGDEKGFAQIVWDRETHTLKGMQIVGEHAGELIAEPTQVMTQGGTIDAIAGSIHPHPVLSEVISELVAAALG